MKRAITNYSKRTFMLSAETFKMLNDIFDQYQDVEHQYILDAIIRKKLGPNDQEQDG